MDPLITAALVGGGSQIIQGLGNAFMGNQAAQDNKALYREQRKYNRKYDIGIPFHHWSDWNREKVFGDTQRGLDMDTAANKQRMQDQADIQYQQKVREYQAIKGEGATLQEYLGSPPPGGVGQTSPGGANTLGNQASTAMASASQQRTAEQQMEWQAQENSKDRQMTLLKTLVEAGADIGNIMTNRRGQDVQMRGQNVDLKRTEIASEASKAVASIAADASITSSGIIAAAQRDVAKIVQSTEMAKLAETSRLNDANIIDIGAKTALTLQTTGFQKDLHDDRWSILFSKMSPENVVASALAVKSGIDIQSVLSGQGHGDAATMDALQRFINESQVMKSKLNQETEAAASIISDGLSALNPFK